MNATIEIETIIPNSADGETYTTNGVVLKSAPRYYKPGTVVIKVGYMDALISASELIAALKIFEITGEKHEQ